MCLQNTTYFKLLPNLLLDCTSTIVVFQSWSNIDPDIVPWEEWRMQTNEGPGKKKKHHIIGSLAQSFQLNLNQLKLADNLTGLWVVNRYKISGCRATTKEETECDINLSEFIITVVYHFLLEMRANLLHLLDCWFYVIIYLEKVKLWW